MRTLPLASGLCCLAVLLVAAAPAFPAAKHFRISHNHFRTYSGKAAELYFKAQTPGDRHVLGHLTSIAAVYTEKAATIMYLLDIEERLHNPKDHALVAAHLQAAKKDCLASLPQDIKLLADLVDAQDNDDIRALGNCIVNELRVFERNLDVL